MFGYGLAFLVGCLLFVVLMVLAIFTGSFMIFLIAGLSVGIIAYLFCIPKPRLWPFVICGGICMLLFFVFLFNGAYWNVLWIGAFLFVMLLIFLSFR